VHEGKDRALHHLASVEIVHTHHWRFESRTFCTVHSSIYAALLGLLPLLFKLSLGYLCCGATNVFNAINIRSWYALR
jgi:hypothetical protein